jgi:hypothetical protein
MTQREEMLRRHLAALNVVDVDAGKIRKTVVDEHEGYRKFADARDALLGNAK